MSKWLTDSEYQHKLLEYDHHLSILEYTQQSLDQYLSELHTAFLRASSEGSPCTLEGVSIIGSDLLCVAQRKDLTLEQIRKGVTNAIEATRVQSKEQLDKSKKLFTNLDKATSTLSANTKESIDDLKSSSTASSITMITPALLHYSGIDAKAIERGSRVVLNELNEALDLYQQALIEFYNELDQFFDNPNTSTFDQFTKIMGELEKKAIKAFRRFDGRDLPDQKEFRLTVGSDKLGRYLNTPQLYRPLSRKEYQSVTLDIPSKEWLTERLNQAKQAIDSIEKRNEQSKQLLKRKASIIDQIETWVQGVEATRNRDNWQVDRLNWVTRKASKNYVGSLLRIEFYIYNYARAIVRNVEQAMEEQTKE